MNEKELRERTNPIYNTAKATLYQMAMAGEKNAVHMAEKLGLKYDTVAENDGQKKAMSQANFTIVEARYATMNQFILDAKEKTILDLPCGYTPRAFSVISGGKQYIGCDLPAVIDEMRPKVSEILTEQKKTGAEYKTVDATNFQSLEKALEGVEGEICISTEGLLMYLNTSELDALCENIRMLLGKHGGCWITPDPESSFMAFGVMSTIFGKEKAIEIFQSSKLPQLQGLSGMPDEKVEAVRGVFQNVGVWVITCEEKKIAPEKGENKKFSCSHELDERKLTLHLSGRIDSITAPEFLGAYEQVTEGKTISDVIVDCENVEYISSAGLRVFMMIAKQHAEHVSLKNVNAMVASVLEQTGFDQIVSIEK